MTNNDQPLSHLKNDYQCTLCTIDEPSDPIFEDIVILTTCITTPTLTLDCYNR